MLGFTRDGASGGPKAKVWTGNEKIVYPNFHNDDFQFGVSNICHKLDQAQHISAANSDGK